MLVPASEIPALSATVVTSITCKSDVLATEVAVAAVVPAAETATDAVNEPSASVMPKPARVVGFAVKQVIAHFDARI